MKERKANKKDIESLVKLIELSGETRETAIKRARRVDSHDQLILVLEDSSRLIGYIGLIKEEDNMRVGKFLDIHHYACLKWIGINPDYRNMGLGSQLVFACDEIAQKWKKSGIWLDCRRKVISFYVANGYKVWGKYSDKGKPRYVVAKTFK